MTVAWEGCYAEAEPMTKEQALQAGYDAITERERATFSEIFSNPSAADVSAKIELWESLKAEQRAIINKLIALAQA
jgi:hypothetical protein